MEKNRRLNFKPLFIIIYYAGQKLIGFGIFVIKFRYAVWALSFFLFGSFDVFFSTFLIFLIFFPNFQSHVKKSQFILTDKWSIKNRPKKSIKSINIHIDFTAPHSQHFGIGKTLILMLFHSFRFLTKLTAIDRPFSFFHEISFRKFLWGKSIQR